MANARIVEQRHATALRAVLMDVQDALGTGDFDGCDLEDLREIIDRATTELERNQPSIETLSTYLNSIARSLRTSPGVRTVVMELDAAMRDAHVPTTWEH